MIALKTDIPAEFLKEEIRCDHLVTKEMKEIWAVEIDLLAELLRVCNKNNIKIFASGGTLLGAIRHKGMIPWDDDIDMMMFREDYTRLCEVAPKEFCEPYFFQTDYTDPGTLRGHAQLRNSLTTGILDIERPYRLGFNQGIFIDIFPLDAVVDDERLFYKQFSKAKRYRLYASVIASFSSRYKGGGVVRRVLHKLIGDRARITKAELAAYEKFELACQMYNAQETELVSTLSFMFDNKQHFKYRKDFADILWVPFEFITIPIGAGYDHALTQRYGDYMQFVKGNSYHGTVRFDTNNSYIEYMQS